MDFEDKINKLNDPSFVDRRLNQIKYIIFEALDFPNDKIKIGIRPRAHKSVHSERIVDIWDIEFDIKITTGLEPDLSEYSSFFKKLDDQISQVFKNFGINQFLEIVKNPNQFSYEYVPLVTDIKYDDNGLTVDIYIDYETITVEGAGGL